MQNHYDKENEIKIKEHWTKMEKIYFPFLKKKEKGRGRKKRAEILKWR